MVKTGVISKIKKDTAIIITKDFNFIEIKLHPGMCKGQTIKLVQTDYEKATSKKPFKTKLVKYISFSSIAAVFIAAFITLYLKPMYSEFRYVDIDINPSLEISLNSKNQVLKAIPFNDDASALLADLNLKNRSLETALYMVLEKSAAQGYLKPDVENTVLISNTHKDNSSNTIDIKEFENIFSKFESTSNLSVIPETLNVNSDIRKGALENSLSCGRYSIYMQAKDIGVNISMEEAKSEDISKLLLKLNTPLVLSDSKSISPTATSTPTNAPSSAAIEASPTKAMEKPTNAPFNSLPQNPLNTEATFAPTKTPAENKPVSQIHVPTPATVTNTPTSENKISVAMFNQTRTSKTKEINPRFKITNSGKNILKLSELRLRYYYTSEKIKNQIFVCDWFSRGESNIFGNFIPNNPSPQGYYLEIGFGDKAGYLRPKDTAEFVVRIVQDYTSKTNADWNGIYVQDDDYSFNPNASELKPWDKISVFIKNELIYGTQP